VPVPHPTLQPGARCPKCPKGRVYDLKDGRPLVRVHGIAPLHATVYECEQLRCNACLQLFAAPAPPGVGDQKYDESVPAMIGELKYGLGLPFHRIERLQCHLGMPVPASTQWDLVAQAAPRLEPVVAELIRQGAAGTVVHNDDTPMPVLEVTPEEREQALGDDAEDRTGVFTTGVVAELEAGQRVALFFTGPRHAGENLEEVLQHRAEALGPPIQMCDANATNTAGEFDTILAACLVHARRQFVDVVKPFPIEVERVLKAFKQVYQYDAQTRQEGLTKEERLRFHQEHSAPVLAELRVWADEQLEQKRVEPNSGLGQALKYLQKHWSKLTVFLRHAGAPLDNNICERALKKAILHRKNALFYKTLNGAQVGDVFMSLIHTAELNLITPFDYLVTVLRHHEEAAKNPAAWLPWTYPATGPTA